MINKRLLIKNLLAHNDENSFYDKKRVLHISTREGKAKFIKHVCALANSNPANNSYIVVGVEDEDNEIIGVDFFDDSKIQNLVNAYIENPPRITYENIPFPHLPEGKVVGLVTIRSTGVLCALKKNIWKYWGGSVFFRDGSMSMSRVYDTEIKDVNSAVVSEIEQHARNNIELTLDGVVDFLMYRHPDLKADYKVFKEQFVVCWAGQVKTIKGTDYYSRVDIELINEQVKLFYSALDEVEIHTDSNSFTITEYVQLGLKNNKKFYPLEKVAIVFADNGTYKIDSTLIFTPPRYNKKELYHIFNTNNTILEKLKKEISLSTADRRALDNLPATHLICYLNGFEGAKQMMEDYKGYVKTYDIEIYRLLKEALRILRKVRYA